MRTRLRFRGLQFAILQKFALSNFSMNTYNRFMQSCWYQQIYGSSDTNL